MNLSSTQHEQPLNPETNSGIDSFTPPGFFGVADDAILSWIAKRIAESVYNDLKKQEQPNGSQQPQDQT